MGENLVISWRDERGQAHALEAFTAALLLLAGLLFALQATAVTPLSASTSNQHLENQQRAMAGDILAVTDRSGSLEAAVLNWSEGGFGKFTNTTILTEPDAAAIEVGSTYTNPKEIGDYGEFGHQLNRTLLEEGSALNVYLLYQGEDGSKRWVPMVFMGTPSDNAVVATRSVALFDNDQIGGDGPPIDANSSVYFVDDAAAGDPLYIVLEVRIVVWQN